MSLLYRLYPKDSVQFPVAERKRDFSE